MNLKNKNLIFLIVLSAAALSMYVGILIKTGG